MISLRAPETHARESIAAVETSTTQEHRASHPRPSRAQEPCHLSGGYRVGTGDRCHWTPTAEQQSQGEIG